MAKETAVQDLVDPAAVVRPPTTPVPDLVSATLTPPPQAQDRMVLAHKLKDDAMAALNAANKTLETSSQQQVDIITTQQATIATLQENLRAAQEHFSNSVNLEGVESAKPNAQDKHQVAAQVDHSQLLKQIQGMMAQTMQPFAQSVTNMQGFHDRTLYERTYDVRLTDDQHNQVLKVQGQYPNMPYSQAILHMPPELAIRSDQKVLTQATAPAPTQPAQPVVPQTPEPEDFRRLPTVINAPVATPPAGQPSQPERGKENVHSLAEVASAMKEATAKGDLRARDEMAAKAIGALIVKPKAS